MRQFKIFTRRNNEDQWSLYGVFASEQEFRNELPHIRAQGLAVRRSK